MTRAIPFDVFFPDPADAGFPGQSGMPGDGTFDGFFAFVVVVMVVGAIVSAAIGAHRWNVSRREGLDPFAADVQVMGTLRRSAALGAPAEQDAGPVPAPVEDEATVEARLTELEELYRRGVITAAEREAARARIIADV